MKTPNKTMMALATSVAIMSPMMPKSVNITINEPTIIAQREECKITSIIIDDKGKRICEYRCGNKFKSIKTNESFCEESIRSPINK